MPYPLPLLLAAAIVGVLHVSAPDHWVTLVALGRALGWRRSRLLGEGVTTAVGHAALSILLGFAMVMLGLLFSEQLSLYITEGTGLAMILGGLLYGLRELGGSYDLGHGDKTHEFSREEGALGRHLGYFAALGAALSPDLSILPIFLLTVPFGLRLALETAVVFGLVSVLALLALLLLGTAGLAKAFDRIPSKYNSALVGFVIAAVGAYMLIVHIV